MSEEREINLFELMAEVISHWRGAFVAFLLGVLVVCFYSFISDSIDAKSAVVDQELMPYADKQAVNVALEYEELYVQAKESGDVDKMVTLGKAVIDAVKGFKDNQLNYFIENSVSDLLIGEKQTENVSNVATKKMSAAVGSLAFCFLYLMFWFVKYMLDCRIKASDDMMLLAGVAQIGRVCTMTEPKFVIDRAIFRLKHHGQKVLEVDKSIELVAAIISAIAKKYNVHMITLASCVIESKTYECCSKLKEVLEKDYHIDTCIICDVLQSKESIIALSNTEGVVLMETAGASTYDELSREIQLIKQLGAHTFGGIIVE